MLILTRKRGESIDLSELLPSGAERAIATVTVLNILADGVVRLGFIADPAVRIVRDNAITTQRRTEDEDYEEDNDTQGNSAHGDTITGDSRQPDR